MKYTRWSSLAGIALLMASAQAFAVKQIISVEEAEVAVGPEASLVSFSVNYATDPDLEQTTGADRQDLHYNSEVIQFVGNDAQDGCDAAAVSCVNEDVSDLTGSKRLADGNDPKTTQICRFVRLPTLARRANSPDASVH